MKSIKMHMLPVMVMALVGFSSIAVVWAEEAGKSAQDDVAAKPFTPVAAQDLLAAREFTLAKPYRYMWCAEKPEITRGTVLVLKVDSKLVRPRQSAMPVLFANRRPVGILCLPRSR